jgi:hypothetical protein
MLLFVLCGCEGFFVVKSPAADATDAPQPEGLLCNRCDEDEEQY